MFVNKVYARFSLLHPPLSLSSHHFFISPKFPKPSILRFHTRFPAKPMKSKLSKLAPLGSLAENGSVDPNGTFAEEKEEDLSLGGGYRLPPKEIRDIVGAPPLPILSFSSHKYKILFLKRRSLRPLLELARPEEKLAGIRIDGSYNARSRMSFYTGIGVHSLSDDGTLGSEIEVHGFPDGAKINFVSW